jgi:hypothetical protein
MPRRRTDKQHQAALAHEAHRADPNYPREHAGSCVHCAQLSADLTAASAPAGSDTTASATPAVPLFEGYVELVAAHIARGQHAHYLAPAPRSVRLTPTWYARRALEGLAPLLPQPVADYCATPGEPAVPDDVLRLVALTIEGSMVVPADPSSQGYRFWVGAVSDVQDHIAEHGTEHLLMDARWQVLEAGEGRLLDRASSQQLAEMAADTHVAEVDLDIDAEPVSSLEQALLITMTALYEAVWEAVAGLLGTGELRVQHRAVGSPLLSVAR